jgi:hypothetical protein
MTALPEAATVETSERPDPAKEIRIALLHPTRGVNFWSKRPVIRMDLAVGAYQDISSAQSPGFVDALMRAMPGLIDHECSIGARGGFRLRLRRGTYAPHIIEHVALELQTMIGHDVGYGKTRGGDQRGEYTLVFEHRHEQVGLRAAGLALEIVQRAFAGTLETVDAAVEELKTLAATPDVPPLQARVFCGVTGGTNRTETQDALQRRIGPPDGEERLIVDVSPAYLLQAGLPYARSEMAIVMDSDLTDVPDRYQERGYARRLVSIVADAVRRGGVVVCPAKEWEVQDYAREQDCGVAIFATDDDITWRDQRVSVAVGLVRDGRIRLSRYGDSEDAGPVDDSLPPAPQVAAALADFVRRPEE